MKHTVIIEGRRLEVELNSKTEGVIHATVADRTYTLEVKNVEPNILWIQFQNRSFEISVVPDQSGYAVSINGRKIQVEIIDARAARRRMAQTGQAGIAEIRAPMPGKIVKVLAPEGTEVQVNEGVLVMEAMKMQNELKSPKKGTVKRVHVNEHAAVNAGDLLALVE